MDAFDKLLDLALTSIIAKQVKLDNLLGTLPKTFIKLVPKANLK